MHKKTASLLAVVVALSGFVLAVFIPAASAEKGHATYTEYCESGTNTVYSEYSQYCETTTTGTNGTSTVVTSTATTITPTSTLGTVTGISTAIPGVVLGADGVASIDLADLTVGQSFTANGVVITVLRATKDGFEMSFGGVDIDVPFSATVSIAADGVADITYFISGGNIVPARVANERSGHKTQAVTARQYSILPRGRTAYTASYVLTPGVSFGSKTTWPTIVKAFSVTTLGSKSIKVPKAAANKTRTAFTIRLAKAQREFVVYFNVSKLQYTKAEQTFITTNKVTSLSPKYTLRSSLANGKAAKADHFGFSYPVA